MLFFSWNQRPALEHHPRSGAQCPMGVPYADVPEKEDGSAHPKQFHLALALIL